MILDILGDLCFGKSFDMKESESRLRYVPGLMTSFMSALHPVWSHSVFQVQQTDGSQMALSPFTPFWVWLKPRGLNWLLAATAPPALRNWEKFVRDCFEERAKVEEEPSSKPESDTRKDFFHCLFRAIDPETGSTGYSREELFGESEMLIVAGSDTTSASIAAALFYLGRNPEIQTKLAGEVTSAFSSLEEIKGGTTLLHSCKYLRAFIQETLRMTPPAPADLPRVVLEGGMQVDGQFLPPGVRVSSCCYCMHYSQDVYPEPFKFRPERWIVDETDETGTSADSVALAESGYCPFSIGPRGCPGKNLAYLEMSIIIAKMIYQFEIRLDPSNNLGGGSPDGREGRRNVEQYQLYDVFVAIRDGPMVQLKKRGISRL